MRQKLSLKKIFKKKCSHVPTFEEWYNDNCADKRLFGEPIIMPRKARGVYNELLKSGFFDKDGPNYFIDGPISFF